MVGSYCFPWIAYLCKVIHDNRPIVEEANKVAPAFSRIFKEMILIASQDKPLPRAGKGTVMRKASLAEYRDEIDEMYVIHVQQTLILS